jgi:hypothetical protein
MSIMSKFQFEYPDLSPRLRNNEFQPKFEPIRVELPKVELPKYEPIRIEYPKVELPKYELIMFDNFPRNSCGGLIPPPGFELKPPPSFTFMNSPIIPEMPKPIPLRPEFPQPMMPPSLIFMNKPPF